MFHVSAQGFDECMINVHYYFYSSSSSSYYFIELYVLGCRLTY